MALTRLKDRGINSTLDLSGKTVTYGLTDADISSLSTGKVLQVIQNSTTTTVSVNNSGGYVDTGLSASITPSSNSSKVLVMVYQPLIAQRNDNEADVIASTMSNHSGTYVEIVDVSEVDKFIQSYQSGTFDSTITAGIYSLNALISPSTTSSFTVKTRMRFRSNYGNSGSLWAQGSGNESTMILIEIAG